MKTRLLLAFLISFSSLQAQDYALLGSDPAGDPTIPFGLDAKALYMAVDSTQDSLWFKLEFHDTIAFNRDWGFTLVIDTNEVPTDGAPWSGQANNSMGYERKITFLNNQFFPPTVVSVTDQNQQFLNVTVWADIIDEHTLVMRLPLSAIDDDAGMNIVLGSGSFDDVIYDDLPDAQFINTTQILSGYVCDCAPPLTAIQVYPNPATGDLTFEYDQLPVERIRVLTMDGRVVVDRPTSPVFGRERLDIQAWPTGVYLLQFEGTGFREIHRVSKI